MWDPVVICNSDNLFWEIFPPPRNDAMLFFKNILLKSWFNWEIKVYSGRFLPKPGGMLTLFPSQLLKGFISILPVSRKLKTWHEDPPRNHQCKLEEKAAEQEAKRWHTMPLPHPAKSQYCKGLQMSGMRLERSTGMIRWTKDRPPSFFFVGTLMHAVFSTVFHIHIAMFSDTCVLLEKLLPA